MSLPVSAVAVFCGSRFGNLPAYRDAAVATGQRIAQEGWELIYGGGDVGLMGTVADAAINAGGTVIGIIPEFLKAREIMHHGVTELVVTDSMHNRKQMMFSRAHAFLILPGGFGTFDEMMEIITWKQLKLHGKPILIVNVADWAAPAIAMLDAAVAQGFASPEARANVQTVPSVDAALARLKDIELAESTGATDLKQL